MDRAVIDEKLPSLGLGVGRLPAPDSMSETLDAMARAAVLDRNLAGRMKKAVGFRNVAVHSYRSIDWTIVYAICKNQLGDFDNFARAVVSHVESN